MISKYRLNKWQVADGYIWLMRWGMYKRVAPYTNTMDAIWFVNRMCGMVERTYTALWRKVWDLRGSGLNYMRRYSS